MGRACCFGLPLDTVVFPCRLSIEVSPFRCIAYSRLLMPRDDTLSTDNLGSGEIKCLCIDTIETVVHES